MNPLAAQSLSLSVSFCLCAIWETCLWLACVSVCMCGVYCICVLSHEWTLGLVGWSSLSWQRYVGWTKPRYLLPRQTDRHTQLWSHAHPQRARYTHAHIQTQKGEKDIREWRKTQQKEERLTYTTTRLFSYYDTTLSFTIYDRLGEEYLSVSDCKY